MRSLEPTGDEFRALLTAATDYVLSVVEKVAGAPASDFSGVAELLADPTLRRPPPERGRPLPELLDVLDRAAAKGVNSAGPGYLAYIPGSGLVSAAIADLLADVLNRYTGIAFAAPALVALEADLLRWLADVFGLPEGAAGILTTGGSLATLSALITARHVQLGEDFGDGTIYVTEQVHQAVLKSARLAGFPGRAIRVVSADAQLRMDVEALRDAVAADRRAGLRPFCMVASAGTTNTGTIDPLPAIADVAAEEGLWLHVDAAYGGFFQLTERGRDRLRGVERADSLVLDPHKGLFLPYGTGCLLVRDGDLLRRAHSAEGAHYLQDLGDSGLPDFNDYSPELTRDFRGLRLWLWLHLHGIAAFRAALDEKLDLAECAYDDLTADPHLQVLLRPDLTTLAIRCASDEATAELLRRVNAEQRVLLSSTRIHGRYITRLSILNHRTDHARVSEALDALHRCAAALAGG